MGGNQVKIPLDDFTKKREVAMRGWKFALSLFGIIIFLVLIELVWVYVMGSI